MEAKYTITVTIRDETDTAYSLYRDESYDLSTPDGVARASADASELASQVAMTVHMDRVHED